MKNDVWIMRMYLGRISIRHYLYLGNKWMACPSRRMIMQKMGTLYKGTST